MSYKIGDFVTVINSTPSGRYKVEGSALIVKVLDAEENRYMVKFYNDNARYKRFIDPDSQDDPQAYVDALNRNRQPAA